MTTDRLAAMDEASVAALFCGVNRAVRPLDMEGFEARHQALTEALEAVRSGRCAVVDVILENIARLHRRLSAGSERSATYRSTIDLVRERQALVALQPVLALRRPQRRYVLRLSLDAAGTPIGLATTQCGRTELGITADVQAYCDVYGETLLDGWGKRRSEWQTSIGIQHELLPRLSISKFDGTVEVHLRLGVDPRHADQLVRGTVVLPHGTGRTTRVIVFAQGEKAQEALRGGADEVGGEDLVKRIDDGWFEFDVAIATPDMMGTVGRLGNYVRGDLAEKERLAVQAHLARPVVERYWAENPMQPRFLNGQWVAATKRDGFWGEELFIDVARDRLQRVKLNRIDASAYELARDAVASGGGGKNISITADPAARVWADPDRVLQVLVNLIRNAKYACDETGLPDKLVTLRIALAPTSDCVNSSWILSNTSRS